MLPTMIVVVASFWAYPVNSLIGYAIMLLGIPPYLYWSRRKASEAAPAT